MTEGILPVVAVLGASGLIGETIATGLAREGFSVVPIARRFTRAQWAAFGSTSVECPLVDLEAPALAQIFTENRIDIVVNCVGVLQDTTRDRAEVVHHAFVERLVGTLEVNSKARLLIHLSIPGSSESDKTLFSTTKRAGERAIETATVPFVILRPGFVIARGAYGGSALIRSLAMLPIDLSPREARQSFATTDVADIVQTIAVVARRWRDGERNWAAVWDVMAQQTTTVADVMNAFRLHLGGPTKRWPLPSWILGLGATAGNLVALLGWQPPIRTTALKEMRRGISGNSRPWTAATGIEPAPLEATLNRLQATVQEKWFARLYLTKALFIATLAVFWVLSGMVALTVSFSAATAILTSHGLPAALAGAAAVVSSLADVAVGLAIAFRSTCRAGLVAGIVLSLLYLAGATMVTPALWIEPLGTLLKIIPGLVLMLVALAMLENR